MSSYITTSTSSTLYASTSATGDIWRLWADDTYATRASSATTAWVTSTNSSSTNILSGVAYGYWVKDSYKETVAQKRKREAEESERYRKIEEQRKDEKIKEKKIEETAKTLLEEVLDDDQKKQLEEKNSFILTSVTSGHRYRVNKGRTRNIEQIDSEGKVIARLCVHPKEYVHDYDTMTIQKLMLENDEEAIRKIANIS